MSLIQDIRDKYARWAVIAIAFALLGFILMDAFAGRSSVFGGERETTLAKVNGKNIDYQQFAAKVQAAEQRIGGEGEMRTQQAVMNVWNQELANVLMGEQYEELGLTVSDKELRDMLYGANPPEDLKQNFTDPNTGVYNAVQAQQQISQISKSGTEEQKGQIRDYLEALENQRLMEKYTSLLLNTSYVPKWFIEKRNVDNSLIANISYVSIPYTSIPDSAVKVSDKEIEEYVKKNQKQFEQKEETRSIQYVVFSGAPTSADSAAAREKILSLKPQFDTTNNYEELALRTGSAMPFYDSYISEKNIQHPNKDSIIKQPAGVVSGPYVDNQYYLLAKVIGTRTIPDTVSIRHILISTHQPNQQTGEMTPIRDDATAKKLIDSIQGLLNSGQSFDSLVVNFSEDPGSKSNGGKYENVFSGQMVAPFNDFIFTGRTGERKVVKTTFGYHLVEILNQKGSTTGYKIAYLTAPIQASQETDNQAINEASLFAGNSNSVASFNENYDKTLRQKGINKLVANDLKPMDYNIVGMTSASRSFIKKVFEADKGDVVGPERVGDDYVVAIVTEVDKAGLPSASRIRSVVEPALRNKKKAEQIKKNIGTVTDLNQLALKVNEPVQIVDSLTFVGGNKLAFESKVVGAAFNPSNKGKISEPIEGQSGVFVIKVDNVSTTPVAAASIEDQRRMLEMQSRQMFRSPVDVLQRAAQIKDYRSKFY